MRFPLKLTLFVVIAGMLSSCGFFDSEEVEVPAYIYVPSMQFETDANGSQGDSLQEFQDVWISNVGILLGTIGMPAFIPVQKTGPTQIELEAGIVRSGQYNERVKYPFVEQLIYFRNLKPGQTDTFYPVFRYLSNTKFRFIEDYDRVGTAFESFPINENPSDSVIRVNDANALVPGKFSGKVTMSPSSSRFGMWAIKDMQFIAYNNPAYLEIDYNSNVNIQLSLYYQDQNNPTYYIPTGSLILVPTDKSVNRGWNKVYYDLSKEVYAGTNYRAFIGILNPNHITPEVYLDNIKLVTF